MKTGLICKTGQIKDSKDKLYDLVYWNAVQKCDPSACGCTELCSTPSLGQPCSVVSSYMGSVFDLMVRTFPGEIGEDVIFRIGMHLVPLYKILCRLKMQEFTESEVMVRSKLGRSINPIFEEIRKTIAVIEKTWQNLGFIVQDGRKKKDRFVGHFNDRNYYDVVESGGMNFLESMND